VILLINIIGIIYCVVPENIHTPPQREFHSSPHPHSRPQNFQFLNTKTTLPQSLQNFHEYYVHPPYPLEKIVLARKWVKS